MSLRPKFIIQSDQRYCRQLMQLRETRVPVTILRLYVKNTGYLPTEVKAWIETIRVNGKLFDDRRALLNSWMDIDKPSIKLGHNQDHYTNLCQVNADSPHILLIRSDRGAVGYNIYEAGICRSTVSVSGEEFGSGCEVTAEIHHDGTLDGLRFVSVERSRHL